MLTPDANGMLGSGGPVVLRGSQLQGWSGIPAWVTLRYGLDAVNAPSSKRSAAP